MPESPLVPNSPTLYFEDGPAVSLEAYKTQCDCIAVSRPPPVKHPALWLDTHGLGLLMPGRRQPFRLKHTAPASPAGSLLVRACGLLGQGHSPTTVLDPCFGFGQDALTLAQVPGTRITGFERQALVYWLAQEACVVPQGAISLTLGDGSQCLAQSDQRWNVLYLDPMFPADRKRALPNIGAQVLRELNADAAVSPLDDLSWAIARGLEMADRVVVKRRPRDSVVGAPNHQLAGKAVRFDVYV